MNNFLLAIRLLINYRISIQFENFIDFFIISTILGYNIEITIFRTAMGRARAWLRMALMQKKLADYLKILIDHKDDILSEYFEPDALMMSEEAIVVMGLLVGLNVIDCNFCVKVSLDYFRVLHIRESVHVCI